MCLCSEATEATGNGAPLSWRSVSARTPIRILLHRPIGCASTAPYSPVGTRTPRHVRLSAPPFPIGLIGPIRPIGPILRGGRRLSFDWFRRRSLSASPPPLRLLVRSASRRLYVPQLPLVGALAETQNGTTVPPCGSISFSRALAPPNVTCPALARASGEAIKTEQRKLPPEKGSFVCKTRDGGQEGRG